MNGLEKAIAVLPRELQERFCQIPLSQAITVQEIRLRIRQPISVTGGGKTRYLTIYGTLSARDSETVICANEWIQQTLDNACRHSLYSHQEELRRGYVTTREGCRIGICGTAVVQQEEVQSFREITSLCIRVSRIHRDCAKMLLSLLYENGRVHSALICGEPACGKSSLLLDLMCGLSERHVYPTVIDERGELKEQALATGCDVLCGMPKPQAIEQAVRCLAPPLLLLDEVGDVAEIAAITNGLYRGVAAIATAHCRDAEQLLYVTPLKRALKNGVFEYLIVLEGREHPGAIRMCVKTKEWLRERLGGIVAGNDRFDGRFDCTDAFATTSERLGGNEKNY